MKILLVRRDFRHLANLHVGTYTVSCITESFVLICKTGWEVAKASLPLCNSAFVVYSSE